MTTTTAVVPYVAPEPLSPPPSSTTPASTPSTTKSVASPKLPSTDSPEPSTEAPSIHYRVVTLDRNGSSSILATCGPNRDVAFDVMDKLRELFGSLAYKIQYKEVEPAP